MQSLASSSDFFVESFHLGYELLHFLSVCFSGLIKIDCDLTTFSLNNTGSSNRLYFISVCLELGQFGCVSYLQKALDVSIVEELGDIDNVIQEVLQNLHTFLDVSLGSLRCLLFRNRGHYLSRVDLSEKLAQPHEVTVASSHDPTHLKSTDLELQEGSRAYAEKSSCVFALRTVSEHVYLPTSQWIYRPFDRRSLIFMHWKVLVNSASMMLYFY